jgi:hypothetical protein
LLGEEKRTWLGFETWSIGQCNPHAPRTCPQKFPNSPHLLQLLRTPTVARRQILLEFPEIRPALAGIAHLRGSAPRRRSPVRRRFGSPPRRRRLQEEGNLSSRLALHGALIRGSVGTDRWVVSVYKGLFIAFVRKFSWDVRCLFEIPDLLAGFVVGWKGPCLARSVR